MAAASKQRTWLSLAIIAIIAAAGIMVVGDLRGVVDKVHGFGWHAFAVALALALANYGLRWLRWHYYLRQRQVVVPVASSVAVFGAGLSLSITPGKIGELIKSYLLRDMHNIPVTATAPIVVAERVSDLLALVCVAVIGVAVYGIATELVVGASALIALGLLLLAWPRPTHWLIDRVSRGPLTKLREPLHRIHLNLAELCRPKPLLVATALSVPAWLCECLGFAYIVNAFPGAAISQGLAAVIYAGTTVAGALSFLPGGLGVTEAGMAYLLVDRGAGIDSQTAVAATLLTRLATLWFAVAVGIGCLAWARQRIRRLATGN